MRNMNQVAMWLGNLKECSGYMGEWACTEPDHIMPVENFYKDRQSNDGLFHACKKCVALRNKYQFENNRPKHPLTGEGKQNWKRRSAIELGGVPGSWYWQSFLDRSERLWEEEILKHSLNKDPADKVLAIMDSMRSEFGQSKPMTKRTVTRVDGEKVPEGWVYVVRNPDVPHILKIGKTFPDGIPDIMSSARRFGRAELVAKYEFKTAFRSEQAIHKKLSKYNLRSLGYKDCGKELFECDEMVAIFAILSEGPVLDDNEDDT